MPDPTATIPESPWLTPAQAAPYSRRSRTQVLTALRSGELVGYQTKPNGKWTIHRDDLDSWIRGEKAAAAPTPVARARRRAS